MTIQGYAGLFRLAVFLLCTLVLWAPPAGAVYYPSVRLTDNSTGFLSVRVGGKSFRGSGVIARDPRLIYSSAHVVYENGRWADSYQFFPGYHSATEPSFGGKSPRGFRYFTSYSSRANSYGSTSARTFSVDFVIFYSTSSFGPAKGWWHDGAAVLDDTQRWKRIVGYPGDIEYTGASGHSYQHATDYFRTAARSQYGSYYLLSGVSTGGGNSGGPVYVHDGNQDYLAGILVSGTRTTAGVRTLDRDANSMATQALQSIGSGTSGSGSAGTGGNTIRRVFYNRQSFPLPDAARRFSMRRIKVNIGSTVSRLGIDTRISTTFRGDLEVYLRSPTGRTRWIARRSGGAANNLNINNRNLSRSFRGVRSRGSWVLFMRDAVPRDRARYRSFALRMTAVR